MDTIKTAQSLFLGKQNTGADPSGLNRYRDYQKREQYFKINFSQVDTQGRLLHFENNVTIVMNADDITGKEYNPRYRADKLKETYCVKVALIDSKNNVVYVSQQTAREEQKPAVEQELDRQLESSKEPVIVKGKIIKIKTKPDSGQEVGAWLDLCGVGIMGYLFIGDWAPTYTPSLRGVTQHGEVIQVVVKEKKTYDTGFSFYVCSRKELMEDPWENPALREKYHEGDLIKITCKSLEENHWFGEVAGLQQIQVFAEYPSSIHDFPIQVGAQYLGKIYHMDVANHSLKARVFQSLS